MIWLKQESMSPVISSAITVKLDHTASITGYDDLAQARVDVASYIIGYYSQVRPHSFNDYLTPVEKEIQFLNQNLLKAV